MNFITVISAEQLQARLHNSSLVIVDCRFSLNDPEYGFQQYRMGHLPGAFFLDLNKDLSAPPRSDTGRHPLPCFNELSNKLGRIGIEQDTQVVVYDDANGTFAGRLWWLLRTMGHTNVAVLDGGISFWQQNALPVTTTLPTPKKKPFRCYLDTHQWLSATEVENQLARNQIRLIDARTHERYLGLVEPIDRKAGHIPKALNRPFSSNLQPNGLFKSPKQLLLEFSTLIKKQDPAKVIHMCGSGVTGCHNLLAMEIAGLKGSRLYAGSWSDWISNPNRTICTQTDS